MRPMKILYIAFLILLFASTTQVHGAYRLLSEVISSAGSPITSSSYLAEIVVGQPAIGISASATYVETGGFLHWGLVPSFREYTGLGQDHSIRIDSKPVFWLAPNYPNPFNPVTTINYSLPEPTHVKLVIYDTQGRRVKTLINEVQEAGSQSIRWDATDENNSEISSGVYFCKLDAGTASATMKLLLLK